jgi:hypothetical protein
MIGLQHGFRPTLKQMCRQHFPCFSGASDHGRPSVGGMARKAKIEDDSLHGIAIGQQCQQIGFMASKTMQHAIGWTLGCPELQSSAMPFDVDAVGMQFIQERVRRIHSSASQ